MGPTWDETEEISADTPSFESTAAIDAPAWDDTIAEEDAVDAEPWLEMGPLKVQKNPMDVNWFGAAKKKFGDEFFSGDGKSQSMSVADNPLLTTSAVPQAAGGAAAAGLSKVGNFIRSGAERFATSPLPGQIASKTDLAGRVGSNVLGRVAAYSTPGAKYIQGVSDSMRGVQGAQKGVAWALDNTPEALGKFANILRQATQHSASGLATADFLMSQSNPEYQELKKNMFEGGSTPLKQSSLFPKEVRRGNEVATVSNEEEFMEARAEGFR